MGSFNTTCFASQQIIVPGSDCLIFPIMKNSTFTPIQVRNSDKVQSEWGSHNSSCYPNAFWNYAGPMIRGKYEDYGRFKLDNSRENCVNLIKFFMILKDSCYETLKGENEFHDLPLNFQALFKATAVLANNKGINDLESAYTQLVELWDKLFEVVQESRVFIRDYLNAPRELQFAVMHKQTADYLIKEISSQKSWKGVSCEQESFFVSYVQKRLERVMKRKPTELRSVYAFLASQLESLDGFSIGDTEGSSIANKYLEYVPKEIDITKLMDDFIEENKDNLPNEMPKELLNKMYQVLKSQIDHRYIHTGLDYLNIKLAPMVYGGQDYQNDTGNAYLKMIKAVNKEIKKEIKAKYS